MAASSLFLYSFAFTDFLAQPLFMQNLDPLDEVLLNGRALCWGKAGEPERTKS